MSYRDFYTFCQGQNLPISRKVVQPKVCELAGVPEVKVFLDGDLAQASLRGYFLSADNSDHPFVKMAGGCPVIVIARGQNRCWTRFVWVKELMHLFDTKLEYVSSKEELERQLAGLMSPTLDRSPQLYSEGICFWRALAALCPEETRQSYIHRRDRGEDLTDLQVATELRIPQQYVYRLFDPNFKDVVTRVLGHNGGTGADGAEE